MNQITNQRSHLSLTFRGCLAFLSFALFLISLPYPAPAQPFCQTPPAGLIAWWRAEGNFLDSAGQNHGASPTGLTFGSGHSGLAFQFDGAQRIVVPDAPVFHLTNSFTIEGWIDVAADGGYVFFRGDTLPGSDPFAIGIGFSTIGFGISSAADSDAILAPITYHQWTHFAAVMDGDLGQMSLFLNGVLSARKNTTLRALGELNSAFGPEVAIGNVGGDTYNGFKGLLDELSVYSRALSEVEIKSLHQAGTAGKCDASVPPFLLTQPQSVTANSGASAAFSVTASGGAPLAYQWRYNGMDMGGQTASALVRSNVQVSSQ